MATANPTGAAVIAQALHDLGVTVIHTLVGIPVAEIAEEAIDLGIRVIGYRNEQACSYAASAYGYLTGKPGVCLLTGGPGILHGMAGIGNASANAFPLVVLGGSSESSLITKGGFQEMDAIALLTPHTKFATRPSSRDPGTIVDAIRNAYRIAWYGRPGPTFVDLPTELIMEKTRPTTSRSQRLLSVPPPPKPAGPPFLITSASELLKSATSPLVIIGKGAAYARAEHAIRTFITRHNIPFLPTPMAKGVIPDSHPLNASSARSVALKNADVILLLGARLNWILHFGEAPKYRPDVRFIQVDIAAEELGRGNSLGESGVSILGDVGNVVEQIDRELGEWEAFPEGHGISSSNPSSSSSSTPGKGKDYISLLSTSSTQNSRISHIKSNTPTPAGQHLTYERSYHIIKSVLWGLSPPEEGGIVFVSEGANTMDISRSSFPLEHPRQRLDAGTYATMGVGMGYAIAAWLAYNHVPGGDGDGKGQSKRKKMVALEGDSAFGFSGLEIETMARHGMDIMIVVMNNSGIYKGDATTGEEWDELQKQTTMSDTMGKKKKGLRSTSLLHETRYDKLADMVGEKRGRGWFIRTEEELARATREAYLETHKVCVLNVIIEPGIHRAEQFGWVEMKEKGSKL